MKIARQTQRYRDRTDAGRLLAELLQDRIPSRIAADCVVYALARGGVPVAAEVARAFAAPLDIVVARKLGAPANPQIAVGAIAADGSEVLDRSIIDRMGISNFHVAAIADRTLNELRRREALYRGGEAPVEVRGRVALVVDDGVATGATMRAAVCALRQRGAGSIIVAVPVGDPQGCERVTREVDEFICPMRPDPFYAVALWYDEFSPTSDTAIQWTLTKARRSRESQSPSR